MSHKNRAFLYSDDIEDPLPITDFYTETGAAPEPEGYSSFHSSDKYPEEVSELILYLKLIITREYCRDEDKIDEIRDAIENFEQNM